MLIEPRTGPVTSANGQMSAVSANKSGEFAVSSSHANYFESVSRGNCFHAAIQASTTLGSVLTATAVTLTLYNPAQSGILVSLIESAVGFTTDAGVSFFVYCVLAANTNPFAAAPSATTAAVVRNCLLGGPKGVAQAFTAATLPATPSAIKPIACLEKFAASAASVSSVLYRAADCIDGKIILAPNTAITIQAVGGPISGIASMMWEEVPI